MYTKAGRLRHPSLARAHASTDKTTWNRGYEDIGSQILEKGTNPDLKEGFCKRLQLVVVGFIFLRALLDHAHEVSGHFVSTPPLFWITLSTTGSQANCDFQMSARRSRKTIRTLSTRGSIRDPINGHNLFRTPMNSARSLWNTTTTCMRWLETSWWFLRKRWTLAMTTLNSSR